MNYYRRYIGDYIKKTSRLSILEHGAYCVLLDHYYAEERPIPLDLDEVYRMCRAITPEERRAVVKILTSFFIKHEDGYHNTRADQELEVAGERRAIARENGQRGGRPRTGGETKDETKAVTGERTGQETDRVTAGGGARKAIQPPSTNLHPPTANRQGRTAAAAAQPGFDEAWTALPKRAGNNPKGRALRAYAARLGEGCKADAVLAGVRRYAAFCRATGKEGSEYVMQGATFFGPERPFLQPWTVANGGGEWWKSDQATLDKGKECGVPTRPGESMHEYRERIREKLARPDA